MSHATRRSCRALLLRLASLVRAAPHLYFRDFILFPQFHFTLLYFTLLYFILLYILISALYFILFYFTSFILELWIEKIRPQITAIMACCNTQMARHHFILLYFTLHYSCGALLHIISFGLH